jgi:phage-related protein
VDSLGNGLWEVRSTHDKVEYRVVFALRGSLMILLHGFVKKSGRTPRADLAIAMERKRLLERTR